MPMLSRAAAQGLAPAQATLEQLNQNSPGRAAQEKAPAIAMAKAKTTPPPRSAPSRPPIKTHAGRCRKASHNKSFTRSPAQTKKHQRTLAGEFSSARSRNAGSTEALFKKLSASLGRTPAIFVAGQSGDPPPSGPLCKPGCGGSGVFFFFFCAWKVVSPLNQSRRRTPCTHSKASSPWYGVGDLDQRWLGTEGNSKKSRLLDRELVVGPVSNRERARMRPFFFFSLALAIRASRFATASRIGSPTSPLSLPPAKTRRFGFDTVEPDRLRDRFGQREEAARDKQTTCSAGSASAARAASAPALPASARSRHRPKRELVEPREQTHQLAQRPLEVELALPWPRLSDAGDSLSLRPA